MGGRRLKFEQKPERVVFLRHPYTGLFAARTTRRRRKKECACPEKLLKVRPLVLPTSLHEICANYVNEGKRRRCDERATSKHEDIYFPTYNDDLGTWVVQGPGCVSANDMFRTTIATCLEALTRQMKNDSQLLQPTKVHMMGSVASSSSKIRCTQENYLIFLEFGIIYLRIGND